MRARPALALLLWAVVTACTPFPQLDDTVGDDLKNAPYPRLVPLGTLDNRLAQSQLSDQSLTGMEARIDRLRARAAGLRGTVIDAPTRRRMSGGVQ